jgi:hypothetical protein
LCAGPIDRHAKNDPKAEKIRPPKLQAAPRVAKKKRKIEREREKGSAEGGKRKKTA